MSSGNSDKPRNVVSEVSIAVKRGKKVIPVRVDMTPYSENIEFDIVNHDYAVYEQSRKEDAFNELLKKIVSTLKMV